MFHQQLLWPDVEIKPSSSLKSAVRPLSSSDSPVGDQLLTR